MKIDVIIPTYKPGKELFTLLDLLERQTIVPEEILLINTEESYYHNLIQGKDMHSLYPNLRVEHIRKEEFDHGRTRKMAASMTTSPVFVMMTQDAIPTNNRLLENLCKNLDSEDQPVAAAYARQLAGEKSGILEQFSRKFNYPEQSRMKSQKDYEELGIKTIFFSDVCAAYRRDIYEKMGGFVEKAIFNEDMLYADKVIKAGFSISYEADALVLHAHNYTNMQQLRRNFDLGVSQAQNQEVFGALKSEKEGMKLVKEVTNSLNKKGKRLTLLYFYSQCFCKYLGYLLGKKYEKLPRKWILALTSNKAYWESL